MLNTKDQYVLDNLKKQRDAAQDPNEIADLNERIWALELLEDDDDMLVDEEADEDEEE